MLSSEPGTARNPDKPKGGAHGQNRPGRTVSDPARGLETPRAPTTINSARQSPQEGPPGWRQQDTGCRPQGRDASEQ